MAVEEFNLVWCPNWAIGKFMLQSAAPSPTCREGVLHDGLEELGIGLKLRRDLSFLRLQGSRRA